MRQNRLKISAKRQIEQNISKGDEGDIPLLRRGRKADRRMQFAPSASLYFADFTVRARARGWSHAALSFAKV